MFSNTVKIQLSVSYFQKMVLFLFVLGHSEAVISVSCSPDGRWV